MIEAGVCIGIGILIGYGVGLGHANLSLAGKTVVGDVEAFATQVAGYIKAKL